jgi:hypothetical protein
MPKSKLRTPHSAPRTLKDLLRESEQAAWDALARGDFSGFGLADLARERGWSKRKLEHVVAQKRIVFWQELTPGGKGRRYTTRAEIEAFDRRNGTAHVSAASLAASNEGRIERLERALAEVNREIRQIRERVLT